jgi:hypothetical protein
MLNPKLCVLHIRIFWKNGNIIQEEEEELRVEMGLA